MEKTFKWSQSGRESLEITLEIDGENIQSSQIKSTGCLNFLKLSQEIKKTLTGPLSELTPPTGSDHSSMIWREMIMTIQEEWQLPVTQDELCHCRKVTTEQVDRSVVYGAHTIDEVRLRTSANTGCGTCKEDVASLISNRLKTS